MTDEDYSALVEWLSGSDAQRRVWALQTIRRADDSDLRLLPYLETLLHDTTPSVVAHPIEFAEVRWVAAHALAAARAALRIDQPVRLDAVAIPLDTDDLAALERGAGLPPRGGVEGVLATFAALQELERLPVADIELNYLSPDGTRYSVREPLALQAALADDHASVSQIIGASSLDEVMRSYQLVIRTIRYAHEDLAEGGLPLAPAHERWETGVILYTGEWVPVTIIGSATTTSDEAPEDALWRLGPWGQDALPAVVMIRRDDLTPRQAREARWLVHRRMLLQGDGR